MKKPMYVGDVLYGYVPAVPGKPLGYGPVSGDALTRAHHGITGFAVTAAPSVWEKVAA